MFFCLFSFNPIQNYFILKKKDQILFAESIYGSTLYACQGACLGHMMLPLDETNEPAGQRETWLKTNVFGKRKASSGETEEKATSSEVKKATFNTNRNL